MTLMFNLCEFDQISLCGTSTKMDTVHSFCDCLLLRNILLHFGFVELSSWSILLLPAVAKGVALFLLCFIVFVVISLIAATKVSCRSAEERRSINTRRSNCFTH